MKICSTSLIIREMQIKTTISYNLTPIRTAIIWKSLNKCLKTFPFYPISFSSLSLIDISLNIFCSSNSLLESASQRTWAETPLIWGFTLIPIKKLYLALIMSGSPEIKLCTYKILHLVLFEISVSLSEDIRYHCIYPGMEPSLQCFSQMSIIYLCIIMFNLKNKSVIRIIRER